MVCKLSLSQMPDCVLLVRSMNKHTKLVHHPMIDVRTPLNPNGRDELWALIGHGATSSPVFLPDTIFHEVQGACPPFQDMDFISLVPPVGPMTRGSELPFHGKQAIVLPPFLAKAFMDADTEDAAELALVGCKNFDAQMARGERGTVEESKDSDLTEDDVPALAPGQSVTVTFHYMIQFLYLVAMGHLFGQPPEVLMILRATDWATQFTASKLGVSGNNMSLAEDSSAPRGSPGGSPTGMFNWDQVGAAITRFMTAVDKHAEAQALSNDKEWTGKSRALKMPAWIKAMVTNASEPIPDGTTNDNGDPITSEECTIPGVTCQALYSPLFMDNFHHFLNLSTFLFMYLTEIT